MRGREQGDEAGARYERHDWWGVVLDAPNAKELASFYSELLGWEIGKEDVDYVAISPPDGVTYIAIQESKEYVRPVWPPEDGRQQQMAHLDFEVSDLDAAVAHALELGADEAGFQPQEGVRVMLDPVGHPFCLYVGD